MVKIVRSIFSVLAMLLVVGCSDSGHQGHGHGHDHQEAKGAHGGRLLEEGNISVELKVFEQGTPPHFRLYLTRDGKAVPAGGFTGSVQLTRLGGRVEEITFRPVDNFLESVQEIYEPHSFDVKVTVNQAGETHSWAFESYEGRTVIPSDVAHRSGIEVAESVARHIKERMAVRGKIVPSEHRIAHIIPRFPGIVREGRKHIGDKVEKGEVLAIVESNQSLQPFEVRSQIAGTVINGHLIVGEYVSENQWVYIVADLSEVWADFYVPLGERNAVRVGQLVEVRTGLDSEFVTGTVSYIAPYADERSQSQLVRVVLPNNDARFVPGMFVTGDLIVSDDVAKVAVKMSALQTFRDWKVVFANLEDTYEIRPVTLGRSDEEWVEVLQGLAAGERYVSTNSYIIKADILKAGAEHDH